VVVLSDLEVSARGPYGWAPFQLDRSKAGSGLDNWLTLPWQSPEQLVLPGFHSAAETGLKRGANGNDIFLNVCALMACGSRSILLSRWPVGGQSSFDLIREYVQELPFAPAAEAWQRSVLVAKDNPIDAQLEPRVTAQGFPENLKAWHPFFWAGYACVDTGSQPAKAP
jgi:CHAT domain-containing protein